MRPVAAKRTPLSSVMSNSVAAMTTASPPPLGDLAIIVCTYRRPELLRACLQSIVTQRIPAGQTVRLTVVDNSPEGSAALVVDAVAATSPIPVRWMAAHPANISVARNAGVAATTEPLVAFIDDDAVFDPGWIDAVIAGLQRHPHDVFFGRIETDFEAPEMASDAVRQLFSRRLDYAAGHDLFAFGRHKTPGITLGTGNCIFRRQGTLDDPEPFDLDFGLGGGEDYDLFCRLERRGRRFGWLPGAAAREFVPKARCDAQYLRRRYYAGGQAFAAAIARGGRNATLTRWGIRLKAAVQAALLLVTYPLALAGGEAEVADHGYKLAGALGKMSFGAIYPLYRKQPTPVVLSRSTPATPSGTSTATDGVEQS